jgi:hypothetical protein
VQTREAAATFPLAAAMCKAVSSLISTNSGFVPALSKDLTEKKKKLEEVTPLDSYLIQYFPPRPHSAEGFDQPNPEYLQLASN